MKPKASAVLAIRSTPTLTPSLANTVLHDHSSALRSGTSLQPLDSFVREVLVPGRVYGSGESVGSSRSSTTPESRAAAAVSTLKVEPGGYVLRTARLSMGLSGSRFSVAQDRATAERFPDRTDGSYDGADTRARIRPVAGSTAATAPLRPARPSYAARCAAPRRVVATSPLGYRSRAEPFHRGKGESSGSVPDRTPSSECSRRVVPYTWEAKPVTGAYIGPLVYVRS